MTKAGVHALIDRVVEGGYRQRVDVQQRGVWRVGFWKDQVVEGEWQEALCMQPVLADHPREWAVVVGDMW